MRLIHVAVVISLAIAACAGPSAGDDQALNTAAVQAAQKRLDDYIAAALADQRDQLSDYWAEGAKIFEPETFVDGRAAMMTMLSEVLKSMKLSAATLQITDAFAHDRGTVVYQYGSIDETLTPRDGKAPPTRVRMFLTFRWVKAEDGVWRIDRLMETPMPPLQAAPKT